MDVCWGRVSGYVNIKMATLFLWWTPRLDNMTWGGGGDRPLCPRVNGVDVSKAADQGRTTTQVGRDLPHLVTCKSGANNKDPTCTRTIRGEGKTKQVADRLTHTNQIKKLNSRSSRKITIPNMSYAYKIACFQILTT